MAVIASALEPANLAVLFELKKERPTASGSPAHAGVRPDRGITGVMQIATLVIMSRLATA